LHVPIAGDIAAVSADLLYGEPPTLRVEDDTTQDRLDEIMVAGLRASLLEGAELCSAYGGVYLRVAWNTAVADYPLVDAIAPDCAAPEWVSGHLRAVTFWRVLSEPTETVVVRHLERHEPGIVYHGLYEGSQDSLGQPVPLTDRPETAHFAAGVGADGGILTGAKRLAVVYIPNMRPHRIIRGTPLGRSDYAGVEHLMDALDEAWSSWMRDIRLGKGRLVVPDAFLTSEGRGSAAAWDADREVYAAVAGLQGANDSFASMMQPVQFAIRVAEHSQTCTELAEQIVRGAGYSAQTFGESGDLRVTATEVQHRERRSYSTRDRKLEYQTPQLSSFTETVLEVDRHIFNTKVIPQRPTVTWPDGVQDAPEQVAATADLLRRANAASTETLVRIVHPDWDDEQVAEEVQRIQGEGEQDVVRLAGLVGPDRQRDGAPGQDPETPQEDDAPSTTASDQRR
jgi:A118 family predicted phage portal protein